MFRIFPRFFIVLFLCIDAFSADITNQKLSEIILRSGDGQELTVNATDIQKIAMESGTFNALFSNYFISDERGYVSLREDISDDYQAAFSIFCETHLDNKTEYKVDGNVITIMHLKSGLLAIEKILDPSLMIPVTYSLVYDLLCMEAVPTLRNLLFDDEGRFHDDVIKKLSDGNEKLWTDLKPNLKSLFSGYYRNKLYDNPDPTFLLASLVMFDDKIDMEDFSWSLNVYTRTLIKASQFASTIVSFLDGRKYAPADLLFYLAMQYEIHMDQGDEESIDFLIHVLSFAKNHKRSQLKIMTILGEKHFEKSGRLLLYQAKQSGDDSATRILSEKVDSFLTEVELKKPPTVLAFVKSQLAEEETFSIKNLNSKFALVNEEIMRVNSSQKHFSNIKLPEEKIRAFVKALIKMENRSLLEPVLENQFLNLHLAGLFANSASIRYLNEQFKNGLLEKDLFIQAIINWVKCDEVFSEYYLDNEKFPARNKLISDVLTLLIESKTIPWDDSREYAKTLLWFYRQGLKNGESVFTWKGNIQFGNAAKEGLRKIFIKYDSQFSESVVQAVNKLLPDEVFYIASDLQNVFENESFSAISKDIKFITARAEEILKGMSDGVLISQLRKITDDELYRVINKKFPKPVIATTPIAVIHDVKEDCQVDDDQKSKGKKKDKSRHKSKKKEKDRKSKKDKKQKLDTIKDDNVDGKKKKSKWFSKTGSKNKKNRVVENNQRENALVVYQDNKSESERIARREKMKTTFWPLGTFSLRSFKNSILERAWHNRTLPATVIATLGCLNKATSIDHLMDILPPGSELEKLKGKRKKEISVRTNDQYRITFTWKKHVGAFAIDWEDYH